ncbi:replication-relaxation family protein [Micromonospora sp. DT4]|uniref:replication-relaxation family protein n=1 Tax=Micromonospora sp. DT4 TaxID=3393438 RepID=UPI003CF1CC84
MPINIPRGPSADPIADANRLTLRDHLLLDWLAEHYLLTADQIARALFSSLRTAQRRLQLLTAIGALYRYRPQHGSPGGLTQYGLGRLGALLRPHAYHLSDSARRTRAPRTDLERRARIAADPAQQRHLTGVNEFFIRLHVHTAAQPRDRLTRWWSEQHATAEYAVYPGNIRPDGHGIWDTGHGEVGFFLEHDRGTENLARVLKKLDGYRQLASRGPTYPVLLHLPGRRREDNLQRELGLLQLTIPVLTAVHADDPAGQVWAMPGITRRRFHLHELPSSHGEPGPFNPTHPDY